MGCAPTQLVTQVQLSHEASGVITNFVDANLAVTDQATGQTQMFAGELASLASEPGHTHASADGKLVVADELGSTMEDSALLINSKQLLMNDQHALGGTEGLTWKVSEVRAAVHGTVAMGTDGVITFVPEANFSGTASFEYVVLDSTGRSAVGSAQVMVRPANDLPSLSSTPEQRALRFEELSWVPPQDRFGDGYYTLPKALVLDEIVPADGITDLHQWGQSIVNGMSQLGLKNGEVYLAQMDGEGRVQGYRRVRHNSDGGTLRANDYETSVASLKFSLKEDGRFGHVRLDEQTGTWVYEGGQEPGGLRWSWLRRPPARATNACSRLKCWARHSARA